MTEPDDIPPELKNLFDAERTASVADVSTRVAVRARLATSVARIPLGHAAGSALLGGASKAIAVVAITIAAGLGTVALVKQGRSDRSPSGTTAATSLEEASSPPAIPPVAKAGAAMLSPNDEHSPQLPRAKTPRVGSSAPAVEGASTPAPSQADLLREAWSALSAGDGARALVLAKQDERAHPDGALVEEREALQISALANVHRIEEARAAATTFFEQHPTSVHRARIERALELKVNE